MPRSGERAQACRARGVYGALLNLMGHNGKVFVPASVIHWIPAVSGAAAQCVSAQVSVSR